MARHPAIPISYDDGRNWECRTCGAPTQADKPLHVDEVQLPDVPNDIFAPAAGAARRTDPGTSQTSAVTVTGRTGSQRHRLAVAYLQIGAHGATFEEAAVHAGLSLRSCYWKRCGELREAGVVEWTGEERPSTIGGVQGVCRITDYGRRVLRGSAAA